MPASARSLRAIPLARGLVRLFGSLSPLFRREGVARGRERLFLIVAILAPLALAFAPSWLGLTAGFITTFALLGWLLRGRTLYLHGAEHRAIAALEQRRLRETWDGAALPTRFSLRCGTNFAALLMPVAIFGGRFWPLPATAFTPRRRVRARAGAHDGAVAARSERAAPRARCPSCRTGIATAHDAGAEARRDAYRADRARRSAPSRTRARVACGAWTPRARTASRPTGSSASSRRGRVPSTASICTSIRARSTASSVRTAPGSPPPFTC